MSETQGKQQGAVQTTGHSWDGDLQEFNNPLPRWWLWGFYATIVFAVIYWFIYPAWPVGKGFTTGFDTITYTAADGKKVTTHWNTRALLIQDMQTGAEAKKRQQYMDKVANASYDQILHSPEMMAFVRSVAKNLFGDNCAACHGDGGGGVIGLFPNLTDDSWLWGGSIQAIHHTITYGHVGFMPSFKDTFNQTQLDDVANYVLSLSGHSVDSSKAARGKVIFNGQQGGCYYCHTHAGTGLKSQGSANLTDSIWTIADVPDQPTLAGKIKAVESVIRNGVHRVMPTWKDRLSPTQIKLLTVYVHELGGGK